MFQVSRVPKREMKREAGALLQQGRRCPRNGKQGAQIESHCPRGWEGDLQILASPETGLKPTDFLCRGGRRAGACYASLSATTDFVCGAL